MAASGSSAFKPVELSAYQAQKLETLMKQQVQDAILARSMQVAKDHKLDSNWRFVSSLGQLKTFKLSGADPCTSTSSWATTLEKTSRATAYSINGDNFGSTDRHTWSTPSTRSRWRNTPVSRLTVSSICGRRDPLDPQPPLQSFRTFGRVQGNYKDIVDVHYATNSADFVRKQKLLSSATLDAAVLRTIRATKDSYLGIKWIAENSFSGKRDICFVEMVGYTINTNGQEIGFVASASVDVPECPELSSGLKLSRVRRKSTMLFLPTADSPKVTSEVFVMGASEASEVLIMGNTQYRLNMAVLNDISLVIDSQGLAKQPLTLETNWIPDENRPLCTVCSRKFRMYRRRHHCRLCGDVVCKSCYVTRSVPGAGAAAVSHAKFCVRCVMGLRAVGNKQDKFLPRVSKMLSFDVDPTTASISTAEVCFELKSPDPNPRASSYFTYYDRTTIKNHSSGLDQLSKTPVLGLEDMSSDLEKKSSFQTANAIGEGVGALVSVGSWNSKQIHLSLAVNSAHSNSYKTSWSLSRSRHSSTSSLSRVSDILEEKMVISSNKINRIVAI